MSATAPRSPVFRDLLDLLASMRFAITLLVMVVLGGVGSRWGAVAGLGLLLLYTAAVGLNMLLGRKPECRCFGAIYALPIGWKALVRNVLFSAAAALLVWRL